MKCLGLIHELGWEDKVIFPASVDGDVSQWKILSV